MDAFRLQNGDSRLKCDCHGLSFADGKYWVDNDQVNTILSGDNYKTTNAPQAGDVAVFRDANGNVVHSTTVTGVDDKGKVTEVSGLGGIEKQSESTTPNATKEKYDASTVSYYHKDDQRTDKQKKQDAERVKEYKKD